MTAFEAQFSSLVQKVRALPVMDAGHAFDHTLRVAHLCVELASDEPQFLEHAYLAGLLHDCFPVAKSSPDRKHSAELCAQTAHQWLQEVNWLTESDRLIVVQAIEDHSYSSGRIPRSSVGNVLQDADRLEALGAIGLYRTIATGVAMGAILFDPTDPWAKERPLDDRKFTIDHFYTKLLRLPETFRTERGRNEAQKRAVLLQQFLDALKHELDFA